MTRNDVHRLFDLLGQLYQGNRRPRDAVTVAIWAEVLKPWSYEQVRQAVVERARVNRYYPDPSEIAGFLPPVDEPPVDRCARLGPVELRHRAELKAWQKEWHAQLRGLGLPDLHEAVEDGITPGEWTRQLIAAGAFDGGVRQKEVQN